MEKSSSGISAAYEALQSDDAKLKEVNTAVWSVIPIDIIRQDWQENDLLYHLPATAQLVAPDRISEDETVMKRLAEEKKKATYKHAAAILKSLDQDRQLEVIAKANGSFTLQNLVETGDLLKMAITIDGDSVAFEQYAGILGPKGRTMLVAALAAIEEGNPKDFVNEAMAVDNIRTMLQDTKIESFLRDPAAYFRSFQRSMMIPERVMTVEEYTEYIRMLEEMKQIETTVGSPVLGSPNRTHYFEAHVVQDEEYINLFNPKGHYLQALSLRGQPEIVHLPIPLAVDNHIIGGTIITMQELPNGAYWASFSHGLEDSFLFQQYKMRGSSMTIDQLMQRFSPHNE